MTSNQDTNASNINEINPCHWADATAQRIIMQRGDKEIYTLASGITPSGVVHFGNFREVITVDMVARALRAKGKNVRFIFSWDDYDTFRKVPANMPKQDELEKYLFSPIVDTPDPYGEFSSYAEHHEKSFESQLEKVGVEVDPIYQAKKYRNGDYKDQIKLALEKKESIIAILNEHRTSPLAEYWLPISIYCEKHKTDKVNSVNFDGNNTVTYKHNDHDYSGEIKLDTTSKVKLPWRVDWPMRWAYENVDFEPGGKDHSSQGGSFTTAKEIVKLFDGEAPIYLQYDFVSIKGAGGKMSSSKGNLITVNDVLKVYEPEMLRWIFASYKPNVDFAVSFDLDVIKTYEDYDRGERLAYGVDSGNQKKVAMAKRVYQLSQLTDAPNEMPFQPAFRHLCNLLQINDCNIDQTKTFYKDDIKNQRDERRFTERSERAIYWLNTYAPEEFKFSLNTSIPSEDQNELVSSFFTKLKAFIEIGFDTVTTDKELHEKIYEIIHLVEIDPKEAFLALYMRLISKEKGPKLAGFMRIIGKEKILKLL